MSVRRIKAGSVDQSVVLRIVDSTDGTPETGVVFDTAGIDLWYRRELAASVDIVEVTLAALTTAHADGGFLHINDGWYRLDLPDAAVAAGAAGVQIGGTVTGMVVLAPYIELVAYDPADAVRLGLTALPNAAAEAAGGLYTRGTGAGQINQAANGMIDTNPVRLNNVAQSLLDLKDFADDGYDPATNKVEGVKLTDTLTTYTGNTPQTGDSFARIGAAGAGLTDLGGMSTTMKGQVQTEAEDALVVHRVDELLNADSDIDGAAPPTVGSVFHELLTKTAGSFTYDQTTDSLEATADKLGTVTGGGNNTLLGFFKALLNKAAPLPTDIGGTFDPLTDSTEAVRDQLDLQVVAVDTVNNKLGAFSASGLNTVLGFFRALLLKTAALTPSDVAGTYDNTTDSLEAIKDNQLTGDAFARIGTNGAGLTGVPWNAAWDAEVQSEVVDALTVDTYAEPTAVPAATSSLKDKIGYLFARFRNKRTQTSSLETIFRDDGIATIGTASRADDSTTLTKGEDT